MHVKGRRKLADVFGVTDKTIQDWEDKGMPFEPGGKHGVPNEYETADCIEWRRESSQKGIQAEKERLTREQADQVEIKNMQARGELVPRMDAQRAAFEATTIFKTQMELSPSRWAAALAAMGADYDSALAYLTDETRIILTELSEGFVSWDRGAADSASSDDGEPVGGQAPKAE